MQISQNDNVASLVFMSPDEAMAHVEQCIQTPPASWVGQWEGSDEGRRDFKRCGSWEEMQEVVRAGWPEGAHRISELVAEASPMVSEIKSRIEQIQFDCAGTWLDVGRAVAGDPECFGAISQMEVSSVNSQIVRLDVNLACSGAFSTEQFFLRGAAACVYADVVESIGKRCEIWACLCHSSGGRFVMARVLVKAAHEPLDMERVAAVLAHAGFYRRCGFNLSDAYGLHCCACCPDQFQYSRLPAEQAEEYGDAPGVAKFGHMHLHDMKGDFKSFLKDKLTEAGIKVENLFEGANQ